MQIVDIKDIKTAEQAKALAYDCLQRIEIEQQNLRALNARIAELSEEPTPVPAVPSKNE